MKAKLILFLFTILNLSYSQTSKVTIIGNLPQLHGGDYVSFSKPIGKYSTSPFYVNSKDTAKLKDNKFIKNLEVSTSGIIYLYEKPFNSISSARFFAEPGDTIFIERKNGKIHFEGKNAIINKMYSEIKFAPVAFNDEVYDIFKVTKKSEKIITKINDKKREHFEFYNQLFLKNQISKACLDYTKMLMEHSIDIIALNIAKNEKFREREKMPILKEEANKVVDFFNTKYHYYNEENLKSLFYLKFIFIYAEFFEKKSLKSGKNTIRYWNQFDEMFQPRIDNLGVLDYLEFDDYKEKAIGQLFLDLIEGYDNEKTFKYKDLVTFYKAYAEKFPDSPYIIPLSETIMDIASNIVNNDSLNTLSNSDSNTKIGYLTKFNETFKVIDNKPLIETDQSFIDALSEKFPNQNVFIDLWATWCSPCIKQFLHNNDLHAFLEKEKIEMLFLSVDKEDNKSKWEKYVKDYKLKGLHYLPSNYDKEKYISELSKFIPSYYIFNTKTKKLVKIEGLPEQKELFYSEISEALQSN
jgi:thiol-disulfide isomerase/thioredoxin